MGNIGSQINDSRFEKLRAEQQALRVPNNEGQVKVLPPDPESRQRLRHTNNGNILKSGGTLSGRHQVPFRNASSKPYSSMHRFSFHKNDVRSPEAQNRRYGFSQNGLNFQVKSYKSEPDLRIPSSANHEVRERKPKKKYKAPPPPNNQRERNVSDKWSENTCEEFLPRRARLFKTRVETKKECGHVSTLESAMETSLDVIEEKIFARQNTTSYVRPNTLSLAEINTVETEVFKNGPKEAEVIDQKEIVLEKDAFGSSNDVIPLQSPVERSFIRGEPSGKESSTPELSPLLRALDNQKPKVFYFGMEKEDSDISSTIRVDEEDERSIIALRLRPVLPRKSPHIPHFSPAAAWRLLDARSQDSGISGDARPPLSPSWTPQQDLADDSSLEEVRRDLPKQLSRHRPHLFSFSLPRDIQPMAFTTMSSCKTGVSSFRRLKRSVSGVLNTLSSRKDLDNRVFSTDQEDANWFLSRSAPNSINDNFLLDNPDNPFSHISPTTRLVYLPDNATKIPSADSSRHQLSAFSKSCEELKMPQSLRDSKPNEKPSRKQMKFTFQSTVRQIERRRMAEKLSKEAEKKEKQRLRELEAMRKVEEEFQKKRAKEKADIRHQLRIYAMDESQWTNFPFKLNDVKLGERQEPEGAISSPASSPTSLPKYQKAYEDGIPFVNKKTTNLTQELSEYRQIQRDYKEYRGTTTFGPDSRTFRQTTIHPEVTCNMPSAKGSNHEYGNYRKDFAYGMKGSKSVDSNNSEDSPRMHRNKSSPVTRF